MGSNGNIIERIQKNTDFATHTLQGQPVIEIAGNKRVLIENHCGVREYGHERITVQSSYGCICVTGRNLELIRMTKEQLVITGQILCVQLLQKEYP